MDLIISAGKTSGAPSSTMIAENFQEENFPVCKFSVDSFPTGKFPKDRISSQSSLGFKFRSKLFVRKFPRDNFP